MDALLAQAKAAKKIAFDYKLFEISDFSEAYKTADSALLDGQTAHSAKALDSKDKLSKALGLFTDINAKGIPKLAEMSRDAAADMKATALKEKADSLAADRFGSGEKIFGVGATALAAKNYETAIPSYKRAQSLYELAYKRARAGGLRDRIGTSGYAAWDQGNYQTAEAKYAAEDKNFAGLGAAAAADLATDAKTIAAGIDSLDEAILRYNFVIEKGRQGICLQKKQATDSSKQKAEDMKANVAVKDDYAAAKASYDAGLSALAAGNYEAAGDKFEAATAAFNTAYSLAAQKRAAAEQAMKDAAAAAESSLKKAQDADPTVQAGTDNGATTTTNGNPAPQAGSSH
jgi:hypothetical protein